MKTNNKNLYKGRSKVIQKKKRKSTQTFLSQKINTTHRFLHLQTLLHLPRLYIPKPNRLIITPADKPLAPQQEGRAKVGVAVEEPDGLGEASVEVGFAVMQGSIEWFPFMNV